MGNLLPESAEIGSFLCFVRMNLWERLVRGWNPLFRCFADRMRTKCGQVRFPRTKPFECLGTAYLMGGIQPLGTASCSLAPNIGPRKSKSKAKIKINIDAVYAFYACPHFAPSAAITVLPFQTKENEQPTAQTRWTFRIKLFQKNQ